MIAATGAYMTLHTVRKGRHGSLKKKAPTSLIGAARNDGGNGGASQASLPHDVEKFDPRGLYTGEIEIERQGIENGVLTMHFGGFNASGCAIDIREVRGSIESVVREHDEVVLDFGQMTTPSVGIWIGNIEDIGNFAPFFFTIRQIVPLRMYEELIITSVSRRVFLTFTKLDIMIYPTHGSASGCRLPLLRGGVSFHLSSPEWVQLHRSVVITPETVGGGASAGLGSS